jgi:hypothetical protein
LDSNCCIREKGQKKSNIQDRRDTIPNSSPAAHFKMATAQKLKIKSEQKFYKLKKNKN